MPRRTWRIAATVAACSAVIVLAGQLPGVHASGATVDAPHRGAQLYATDFDPSTFNQQVVGSSASLSEGSGPSLVCTVGSSGSKMIASVKNWSVHEPTSIWAEEDIRGGSISGGYQSGFYFEGIGGNHRHLHIDFAAHQIVLRDPNYNNEGPVVSVPSLSSGQVVDIVVIDTSPEYKVYVNGTEVIDYTDSFAPSTPGAMGFDCASAGGTGSDSISDFSVYSVSGACAAGWTCADIGAPSHAGSASLNGSTWTVQGGGADIYGTSDQFQFVERSLAGNGSVSARITSQSNTSSWAKAGVMLRLSTDPSSPYYALFVTPSNGLEMQYRATQGSNTGDILSSGTVPVYLKITRSGSTFAAYSSSDGSTWTLLPNTTHTFTSLSGTLLEGLAVTAHNASALCTVTLTSVSAS